jgi:sugar transferase (PEP-CTERM system associated)
VPHVRILRHYVHTPYLVLAAVEFVLVVVAVAASQWVRLGEPPVLDALFLGRASVYAAIVLVSMTAMGVYEAHIREGYTGMMLRTAVAVFLIASIASAVLHYVLPDVSMGRGVLALAAVTAFVLIALIRWLAVSFMDEERLKRRIVVLGTGERAAKIASRMRRRYDQRAFRIVGYVPVGPAEDRVSPHGAEVLHFNEPLSAFCDEQKVHEIVVALDERRRGRDSSGGLPLDELLECRLNGVAVSDIQAFIERESGKLDIELLQPSWMVFSDGFIHSTWRTVTKRSFDVLVSALLLLVAAPIMLLTALAIWIESGFRGPILYRQQRVGLDGRYFEVVKFRSMATDAEKDGQAVWATANDPRTTLVGRFIRRSRIDELPQVFNVLRGDMSFVGPRPERPQFVDDLSAKIPYYEHRHRIKPGLTGWAQLCYPYGASLDDAREKLQYDLYYLKNHSLLLDLIILVQTVDVILVGEGAR